MFIHEFRVASCLRCSNTTNKHENLQQTEIIIWSWAGIQTSSTESKKCSRSQNWKFLNKNTFTFLICIFVFLTHRRIQPWQPPPIYDLTSCRWNTINIWKYKWIQTSLGIFDGYKCWDQKTVPLKSSETGFSGHRQYQNDECSSSQSLGPMIRPKQSNQSQNMAT